jgi:hypothetical protein
VEGRKQRRKEIVEGRKQRSEAMAIGRKETTKERRTKGRKERNNEGRKEGNTEGRKEILKETMKEGRKEGTTFTSDIILTSPSSVVLGPEGGVPSKRSSSVRHISTVRTKLSKQHQCSKSEIRKAY